MNNWMTYENIWARNIIFGSLMFALMFTQTKFSPAIPGMPTQTDAELVVQFILLFLSLFIYNHYIIRKLFLTKKYALFALITVIYLVLMSTATLYFEKKSELNIPYIGQLLSALMSLFIGTSIYLGHSWVLNNISKTKIQLLNKEAEITFLKQQLSPHFLFNAINNLYGTSLAAPEIVSDKILELSDLLRYQVESTTKNHVTIEEERAFVENYFNYTTYKSNDLIVTNITEGTVKSLKLPPLLFLPLIENAIKYSSETENAYIHILWIFEKNTLIFHIENSYLAEGSKIKGTKIGLENLKKRLELLNIKHSLKTDISTLNTYKTELKLWELSINA
jgi:two-component system, LytTR family, sensor kinase